MLLDGVWLSRNKRITYLLTYLLTYVKPERYGQVIEEVWSRIHNTGWQLTADSIMTIKQRLVYADWISQFYIQQQQLLLLLLLLLLHVPRFVGWHAQSWFTISTSVDWADEHAVPRAEMRSCFSAIRSRKVTLNLTETEFCRLRNSADNYRIITWREGKQKLCTVERSSVI